uniref:Uncharacterized protein n=1 Tax=Kalanchoe fedtschenkoi TaxID=63787 RepID=A0A7N1A9Z6_KALFE
MVIAGARPSFSDKAAAIFSLNPTPFLPQIRDHSNAGSPAAKFRHIGRVRRLKDSAPDGYSSTHSLEMVVAVGLRCSSNNSRVRRLTYSASAANLSSVTPHDHRDIYANTKT